MTPEATATENERGGVRDTDKSENQEDTFFPGRVPPEERFGGGGRGWTFICRYDGAGRLLGVF